jgi:(p)ppGpp synthase/HD superfamily hydrolase
VHSTECPNVQKLLYHPEREIEVAWAQQGDEVYRVALAIECEDRPGMLAQLTEVIARLESNIRHIQAETGEAGTGRAVIDMVVEVRNRKHLEKLQREIASLAGILQVDRRMGTARGNEALG